ncbi:integrin alpha-IIb [Huso huso]|uniref:Integrin alpha-IIb n=1 Tax=Huso huso TaxID=61971 RepID=A0ABR0YDJ0_HUSHU
MAGTIGERFVCQINVLDLMLYTVLLSKSCAINLDVKKPTVYSGPEGSYFGFSMDFYLPATGNAKIVVGAPKTNTSQPGVTESGAVFLCPWSENGGQCDIMPFDTKSDQEYVYADGIVNLKTNKSNQWLGATVRSDNNYIVACAPYFKWNAVEGQDESGITPVGNCHIAAMSFGTYTEYSPCRSYKTEQFYKGHNYNGDRRFCETGFSSDITKDGKIVLGAPGSFYFMGQTMAANIPKVFESKIHRGPIVNVAGETKTAEDRYNEYDGYQGYSVAVGEFTGDSVPDYVVGIPNGRSTSGTVIIYNGQSTYTLSLVHSFFGTQVTAYFGHTVAVTDINNDGKDDVFIGAPLFMERWPDNKLHQVGQVYLFLQREGSAFSPKPDLTLTGRDVYGRFGSAIATLGDIDQDGYNDIAVGAPYSGSEGRVFIFTGQSDGVKPQYTQVLESPFPKQSTSAAFGFSLRGGADIDSNGYPDLLVGAWGVSKVAVYRSQPVILAKAKITLYPDVLNPDTMTCKLPQSNTPVSCFTIMSCVTVSGRSIPKQIVLNSELQLDRMKQRRMRRTLFLDSNQPKDVFSLFIDRDKGFACKNFTAYLRDKSEFKDKLSPIIISLNYTLNESSPQGSKTPLAVLHGQKAGAVQTRIILDCGTDNICIPDLKLSAYLDKTRLLIGNENPVLLVVSAENQGEGAYETELRVQPPPHTHFQGVLRNREGFTKLTCTKKKENDTVVVICDLGNPMKQGGQLKAGLNFSVSYLDEVESSVLFELQVKSKNSHNPDSNVVNLKISVSAVASLEMRGGSSPVECVLPITEWQPKSNLKTIEDIGPQIEHIYELHNKGPGTVNARMEVDFPTHLHGDIFLYVFSNAVEENLKCETNLSAIDRFKLVKPSDTALNQSIAFNPHNIDKREVDQPEQLHKEPTHVNCSHAVCVSFRCQVTNLERGKSAVIRVMSRLWVKSFLKRPFEDFILQSMASYSVISMPYKIKPEVLPSGSAETLTEIVWISPDGEKEVPLWWIIVAIIAGLILLSLLIFILWKIGFFERTRPPNDNSEELNPEDN